MPNPEAPFCNPRDHWKRRVREARYSLYVRAIGIPYDVVIEPHRDDTRVDHVWMTVEVPPCGRLRLSVNTLSRLNRDAGFDPRIRLGVVRSTYASKPEPVLEEHHPLDYSVIDAMEHVEYETMEHDPLEEMLIEKGRRAVRIEAWGELYIREHLGIHQLHSRRASCAVTTDYIGKDGALKLYYPDMTAELLLMKFCGQP